MKTTTTNHFTLQFANGDPSKVFFASYLDAVDYAEKLGYYVDTDGFVSGADRTLVWETEADSENDAGAKAIASIKECRS